MIEQLTNVLGSFRDKEIETVIIQNYPNNPVFYSIKPMNMDEIKDYLINLNKETLKV